jgi:hypothetical protein
MTHIAANVSRHASVHNLGSFQFLHEEVHLSCEHDDSIDLVYTAGTALEMISIPTLICHHLLDQFLGGWYM